MKVPRCPLILRRDGWYLLGRRITAQTAARCFLLPGHYTFRTEGL